MLPKTKKFAQLYNDYREKVFFFEFSFLCILVK